MLPAIAHMSKTFTRMAMAGIIWAIYYFSASMMAASKLFTRMAVLENWQASLKQFIILVFGCFGKF